MVNSERLLDKISVGSMILDPELNVLFWNRMLENWTGIKKSEIIGKKIYEKMEKFNQLAIQTRLQSVFTYGTPVVFSSQIHKYLIYCELPNNRFRYQQTMVTAVKSENNPNMYYALFSIQDVTEITEKIAQYKEVVELAKDKNSQLEKSRAQIQASEMNFRDMVEFSKDAIVVMHNNKFMFFNSSLLKLLGCDSDNIMRLNFEEIQTDKIVTYDMLWQELKDKFSMTIDLEFRKNNGKKIYINALFKRTMFENKGAIVGIFHDITSQLEILEVLHHDLKSKAEKGELLTICSSCHKVKDNYEGERRWIKLEKYLSKYISKGDISHGLCDDCFEEFYPKEFQKFKIHNKIEEKKKKKE